MAIYRHEPSHNRRDACGLCDGAKPRKNKDETQLPAHFGHGIEFIRVCLHLRYRAKLAGVHIAPNNLCAGWQYGLSHASRYARALGDEPARMVEAKFREILTTPIPGLFHDRWLNDISS